MSMGDGTNLIAPLRMVGADRGALAPCGYDGSGQQWPDPLAPCVYDGTKPSKYEPGGPWMQTLDGKGLDLVNPDPSEINFRIIAKVLARTPRFGGHTTQGVYTVAQHCLEGARAIERDTGRSDWAAAFLLHDAHEAYMGDITTPVVRALQALAVIDTGDLGSGYIVKRAIATLKDKLDAAIYAAAHLSDALLNAETWRVVKEYDIRMLAAERRARMAPSATPWESKYTDAEPIVDVDLHPWSPDTVAALYFAACRELLPVYIR